MSEEMDDETAAWMNAPMGSLNDIRSQASRINPKVALDETKQGVVLVTLDGELIQGTVPAMKAPPTAVIYDNKKYIFHKVHYTEGWDPYPTFTYCEEQTLTIDHILTKEETRG